MNMGRFALAALLVLGVAMVAEVMMIEGANPTSQISPLPNGDIVAPAQIRMLLTRACYDCHSNQTRWPWYSQIPPVSWLIARDVALGRRELNFSEWRSYYPQTRRRKLQWMGRALREHSMPPWSYRLMHPGARLTGAERALIVQWIESGISTSAQHAVTD